MPKVALVLSGCGHLDGAEIRETVLSLLYLDQAGASVEIYAPDKAQHHVVNHLNGQEAPSEARNVLTESARIARGTIQPLSALNVDAHDALILPGGYGAAKNLSDFAFKGADCTLDPDMARVIQAFYAQQKPIGAICIAPILLAVALRGKGLVLTIGEDSQVAAAIEALGHQHQPCATDIAALDSANRIATCSAYMREDSLAKVACGIEQVVGSVLQWV